MPNAGRHAERGGAGERGVPHSIPSKRRRKVAEAPTQPTRPDWAGASAEGDREDVGDSERKMARRLYYNIGK